MRLLENKIMTKQWIHQLTATQKAAQRHGSDKNRNCLTVHLVIRTVTGPDLGLGLVCKRSLPFSRDGLQSFKSDTFWTWYSHTIFDIFWRTGLAYNQAFKQPGLASHFGQNYEREHFLIVHRGWYSLGRHEKFIVQTYTNNTNLSYICLNLINCKRNVCSDKLLGQCNTECNDLTEFGYVNMRTVTLGVYIVYLRIR